MHMLLSNPIFISVWKLELQETLKRCQLQCLSLYLVRKPNLISTQKFLFQAQSFPNVIISGLVLSFNEATKIFVV